MLFSTIFPHSFVFALPETKLAWSKSYQQAKLQKKPLLVYFGGKNSWCQKLETQIFADPFFQKKVGAVFSFVQEDTIPDKLKKHGLVTRPMVMLVDENNHLITQLGFLPITAQAYAKIIVDFLADYRFIRTELAKNPPIHILEKLYEKAKTLGCLSLEKKIFLRGLENTSGTYFLVEKYAALQDNSASCLEMRQKLRGQIVQRDPKNVQKSFYRLALLDFQYLSKHAEKSSDPKEIVDPLANYVATFPEDEEHGWKVEMMIAQYLFTKGLLHDALLHARACYKKAPLPVRKEIANSIQHIRAEIRHERR